MHFNKQGETIIVIVGMKGCTTIKYIIHRVVKPLCEHNGYGKVYKKQTNKQKT